MSIEIKKGVFPKKVDLGLRSLIVFGLLSLARDSVPKAQAQITPDELQGRIVFVSKDKDEESTNLYLLDLQNNKTKRLTFDKDAENRNPRFMKGGQRIVYDSQKVQEQEPVVNIIDSETGLKDESLALIGSCPSEDEQGEIVHSISIETIFTEEVKIECPLLTNNEHIIFQINSGEKSGMVVAKRNADFELEADFVEGSVMPLEVSVDNKMLLYKSPADFNTNPTPADLFTFNLATKKHELIVKEVYGASWNKTGEYVLYSAKSAISDNYELSVYSIKDKKIIKLLDFPRPIWSPNWDKETILRAYKKGVVLAPGITTEVVGGRVSLFTGSTNDLLVNRLVLERGFLGYGRDIFVYSPTGWRLDRGYVYANSSPCSNSLTEVSTRARKLIDYWKFLQTQVGITDLVQVAHSEGGVTTDMALEIIMNEQIDIDLSNFVYVSANTPHIGLNKPFLSWLGQHWPIKIAEDCLSRFSTLPSMQFFDSPTGRYLLDLWDDRTETRKRLKKLTDWLTLKGAKAYSIVNIKDCAINMSICILPEFQIKEKINDDIDNIVLLSQRLPGSIIIERNFGQEEAAGHGDILLREPGLSIITALVGDQYKRG